MTQWDEPGFESWKTRYWYVYYWEIVIPLTLLSAYLILWPGKRPERQTKPPPD